MNMRLYFLQKYNFKFQYEIREHTFISYTKCFCFVYIYIYHFAVFINIYFYVLKFELIIIKHQSFRSQEKSTHRDKEYAFVTTL